MMAGHMRCVAKDFVDGGAETFPDSAYGPGYRCSAEMTDGTWLPCVIIRRRQPRVDLVGRRLAEEKTGKGVFGKTKEPYREMLSHFVTTGNRVNATDLRRVSESRFAIPLSLLRKVEGETVMAWTGFVLEMNDTKQFAFGTSFLTQFFDLPDGYNFENVSRVFNHSYLDRAGQLRSIHDDPEAWRNSFSDSVVYREKPYFECFID